MVLSWIWIIGGELVQLANKMFSSPRVIVPVCVNAIGSSKICIFVATITTVAAVGTVGAIIFSTPLAVTGRVPMNVTYLTSNVDVGRGVTITTATTIITVLLARTAIIIARPLIIALTAIVVAGAVIAVLLARAILAPTIVIARELIVAWTTNFISGALLLVLVIALTAIIITWTSITASHVR
jgi:hypothetical protein